MRIDSTPRVNASDGKKGVPVRAASACLPCTRYPDLSTLIGSIAEAMIAIGVSAATDITGFGLIGHAFEMAQASGVTLEIEAAAAPLMERLLDLAGKGCLTRAHRSKSASAATATSTCRSTVSARRR